VPPCCGAQEHPWETFSVLTDWSPDDLRCLIIGESPGADAVKYFYNQRRKVLVRTIMLRSWAAASHAGWATTTTMPKYQPGP
jgi:hypothetical protein